MHSRQKIIEAAFHTFYVQGFHACGVDLLAQRMGVTKRTLYAHFGSKEGLIDAVLTYRHQSFIARVQEALEQRPPAEAVAAYLDFIAAWTQSPDFHGCLFINACAEFSDPAASPKRHAAEHKRDIRARLQARLESAGAPNAAAQADAAFLIGEGLTVAAQTQQTDLAWPPKDWPALIHSKATHAP